MDIKEIKTPRKRKQIVEFMDERHDAVMDDYYEILETYESDSELIAEMKKLIGRDNTFFDPYIVVADLLDRQGKYKQAKKLIEEGVEKAIGLIVDKAGNWPKHMAWGWLENRHLMRIVEQYADYLERDEKHEDALYVYRKLFRMNPNDNQGVRDKILAIRLGLGPDEWYQPFLVKKGPLAGEAMEAIPVMEWFEENAKKFPDEFDWWFKEVEKYQ